MYRVLIGGEASDAPETAVLFALGCPARILAEVMKFDAAITARVANRTIRQGAGADGGVAAWWHGRDASMCVDGLVSCHGSC